MLNNNTNSDTSIHNVSNTSSGTMLLITESIAPLLERGHGQHGGGVRDLALAQRPPRQERAAAAQRRGGLTSSYDKFARLAETRLAQNSLNYIKLC